MKQAFTHNRWDKGKLSLSIIWPYLIVGKVFITVTHLSLLHGVDFVCSCVFHD